MLRELFQYVNELIQDHWMKSVFSIAFLALGWFVGRYRERNRWEKKEFFSRVNVSLNIIQEGRLQIRTLMEEEAEAIYGNTASIKTILHAAKRTTEEDPILPLEKEDYWYFLNPILNELSEKFAEGFLRRDMGLETQGKRYVICLTSEVAGDLRQRKIRVMVIGKDMLKGLADTELTLEKDKHKTRSRTLKQLAVAYQEDKNKFLELELCL